LVLIFRFTNSSAGWLFNHISRWTVASSAFNFIIDWAELLSAAAAISMVGAALLEFREIRRQRALTRVHDWARGAVIKLTGPSREISTAKRLADWESRIMLIRTESSLALANARACGNGLELKVGNALKALMEFEGYLYGRTGFADGETSLKTAVSVFTEVLN